MSLEENNENSALPSSSMSSIHSSKPNKNSCATSTANRISPPPPPNLTINQFQPVFKEARKKKQELNTKTNDDRRNLDHTLFNTQHDNNSSICNTSTEPNSSSSKFKDDSHLVCSTNVTYSDGSIKCNSLGKHQSNTALKNIISDADVLDQAKYNKSYDNHFKLSEQELSRNDIKKSVQPKLDLVAAQSHKDSNVIQSFVVSPSPTCNINDVQEGFKLHQPLNDDNLLSSTNNSEDYRQTVVSLDQVNEKKIRNGENFTTSILNEDFPGDISNELCSGYSPSKQPLINDTEMEDDDDEENGSSKQNINSITASKSRPSTWTANKARRLSLLGQSLIKSSSSKIKCDKQRPAITLQPEPTLNKKRIGIPRISFSSKTKFNKDEDTSSNSGNDEEKDPER